MIITNNNNNYRIEKTKSYNNDSNSININYGIYNTKINNTTDNNEKGINSNNKINISNDNNNSNKKNSSDCYIYNKDDNNSLKNKIKQNDNIIMILKAMLINKKRIPMIIKKINNNIDKDKVNERKNIIIYFFQINAGIHKIL